MKTASQVEFAKPFVLVLHYYACSLICQVRPCRPNEKQLPKVDITNYLEGDKINYSKLLTDEVLAVDKLLVEAAKKNMDVAGFFIFFLLLHLLLMKEY